MRFLLTWTLSILAVATLCLINSNNALCKSIPTLEIRLLGGKLKSLGLSDLKKLVSVKTVEVEDHNFKRKTSFLAIELNDLLDTQFRDWRKKDEIVFMSTDGASYHFPVDELRKFQAFLAFETTDGQEFSIRNEELGPFYLIWDNISNPKINREKKQNWITKIESIDFVPYKFKYPRSAPKSLSSEKIKKGFMIARKECLSCHSVNGEGGNVASDLNQPQSVTRKYTKTWLKKFLSSPNLMKPGVQMPPFRPWDRSRDHDIDLVVRYLNEIASESNQPIAQTPQIPPGI